MLKNLKLLLKLTEETQGKCDGRVTQAAGSCRTRPTLLSFRWKSALQRGEVRHLGLRVLVPSVLGSLVSCYTGVTEFNRFLETWALRCLDIIIGQQS